MKPPEFLGFQKPGRAKRIRQVRMATIIYEGDSVVCNCGWITSHYREKVREDRIDRHLAKRHQGRGIRL